MRVLQHMLCGCKDIELVIEAAQHRIVYKHHLHEIWFL